ncbi:MAG: lamin tail domain-containing protein, partial [Candidatus Izemoplasmatales bacterium]
LFAEYQASLAQIKAAGIGVSNTLEDTEYALLFNHGTFTYDTTDYVLGDFSFEGATDLFISEYGEGSSYNRWIEIYNGTQFPVDMSEYSYAYDQNKNGTWSSISSLSGTLNPGEVYVIVDSYASSTYEAYADIQFFLDYSGDDAVGLLKNGSLIDIVGVFGQDPGTGWTVNGTANATYDNVIRRKASAYQPTTSWNSSDWEVLGYQSTSSLGTHTSDINFDVDVFSFSDFDYTATIYDVSDSEIDMAITRSYNYADYIYDSPIYVNVSPFYYSLNNNNTSIRYSSNLGNIYYWDNSGLSEIDLVSDTNISGITQNTNVDYLNVHNHGNLNVINVDTGDFSLYISGFSKYLNTDRYIKNSINEGNITFADISGNGNIYVSGLVNFNNSGDLHIKTEPIASEGIMNSINAGNISSTYTQDTTTIFGINGLGNTFVGGLATFNKGSIQDSANLGNITVYNSSTTTTSFSYEESDVLAGLSKSYTGGIVAGGVSSMVIDGNSRIYDSSNNGDVVVMAYQFARAGGVLGVSLYRESTSGGVTSDMGLVDTIQFSILSNGLNFGNISTITSLRADYDYDPIYPTYQDLYISTSVDPDYYGSTTDGTAERPPVYASAGGVIGYGLSVMKNMLNHGIISSTDVAGGVVGATYVLGEDTTVVNITTAVNYGVIQVVDNNDYFSIDGELLTSSYISSYYITGTEREAFLFPLQFSREYIMSKPGFGGIFGRLQRGLDGIMTSSTGAFNFIVNADPNIDLIGRLDQVQNFSSSMRFFRFIGAKYYSARLNDTTPATFSGFIYSSTSTVSVRAADVNYLGYTQSGSTYTHRFEIILQDVGSYTLYWQRGNSNETITYFNDYVEINTSSSAIPYSGYTVGSNYTYGNDYYIGVKSIPWITENPNDDRLTEDYNDFTLEAYEEREYIYGPYFPMRTDTTLTNFIYFSEYNLLADRFRKVEDEGEGTNIRENGMYVLSTTAGQEFGSVLPRNISTNDIELIDEDANVSLNIDYENYNFAPEQTVDLYSGILDTYKDLYQTRYNDKAELTDSDLQNLVLVENNGSGTVLDFASIDYTNKIIDFTISLEAFSSLQDTASYRVYDALASANSLIAIRPEDTALSLSQLSTALFDERYDEISTSYPADLEVSIPQTTPTNQMLNLGYLTVYSEAFINNSLFASSDYYNTYLVRVTFLPRPPSNTPIGIYQVAFNGLSPVTPAGAPFDISETTIDITSAGDVNYDGSLTLYINDGADILDTGYDFSEYFDIYYNSMTEPLNTEYYTVTSTPVDSSGNYIITFDFDDRLASGTYEIVYSYFSASTDYTVVFDKAPSSLANILDLDYYSMSDSLSIIGNQITSDINMGKIPNINNSLTPGENITVKTDNEMAEYLSRVTYDISYMFTDSFVISKFATVTGASLNNISYSLGYITYEIQYIITAEDEVTSNTYTHTITERSVDLTAAYKNNNDIPFDEMTTTREALNTEFSFDLGFDQSDDMSGPVEYTLDTLDPAYLEVTVTGVDPDSQAYDPSEIVGLSYTASNLLYIDMGYQTLPGTYTFTISYNRGVAGSIIFAQFDITKFEGTTAYLEDMKFSSILNETTYPKIYVSDSSGTPISSPYDPQFYYLGIDYDGADVNGVSNFKVK